MTILSTNPFEKSAYAARGDKSARDIYIEVGLALDRWEHCETSFAVLYGALIGGHRNHVVMRSFGIITAPHTKRQMIEEACNTYFAIHPHEQLKAQTRKLLKLYGDAAARRNEIAHAMVMGNQSYFEESNALKPGETEWFLVPSIFASRKMELFAAGSKYRFSSADISGYMNGFVELSSAASSLGQLIRLHGATVDAPVSPTGSGSDVAGSIPESGTTA